MTPQRPLHVELIVPEPFGMISGGYGYDRRIVAGLRQAGHRVDVMELAGAFPMADDRARRDARAAWDNLAPDTTPLIDGLALPAFQEFTDALSARTTAALIHHPVSMETGLSDSERAVLDAAERELFAHVQRLIVTSDTTADTLRTRFHIPPERIRCVVPGTDAAPRCFGPGGATCQILSIGTLIPRKGHDVLLRALASLQALNWFLTIVGSPDRDVGHAQELIALAGTLNITHRVRFAGEATGEVLEAFWRAADVFALATHYEGYGMAIAEALKRGLPVVVTSGGAAGALVAPGCGYVCATGDHGQLASSLRSLIPGGAFRRAMAQQAWRAGEILPSWQGQSVLFASALG